MKGARSEEDGEGGECVKGVGGVLSFLRITYWQPFD